MTSVKVPAKDVKTGAWQVRLDPGDACATPLTLYVRCGKTERTCSNVLVGDVWLCGGQSNMRVLDYVDPSLVSVGDDTIRPCAITATGFQPGGAGWSGRTVHWRSSALDAYLNHTPEDAGVNVDGLSGMPYLFAKSLRRKLGLGIPIGLVNVARGGMPLAFYLTESYADDFLDAYNFARHEICHYIEHEAGCAAPLGNLWNTMVEPLANVAFKGCIWYQGEADSDCSQTADASNYFVPARDAAGFSLAYGRMMAAFARQVRDTFGEKLPFYFMQIASWPLYAYDNNGLGAKAVRDGQQWAANAIPEPSGMATAYDLIGVATNPGHPYNKQESGVRLAAQVLREVYGVEDIEVPVGPRVKSVAHDGKGNVVVRFDTVGRGLVAGIIDAEAKSGPARVSSDSVINGFEFTQDGVNWGPLSARIEGDAVVISMPNGFHPTHMRYAYYDSPCGLLGTSLPYVRKFSACNLYSKTERAAGDDAYLMPAFPFNATAIAPAPVPVDPLPENPSDIHAVLQGSELDRFVKDRSAYDTFRAWVVAKGVDHRMALDARSAFFSFVTDQDAVVTLNRAANSIAVTAIDVASRVFVSAEIGNFTFGPHPQPSGDLRKIFGVTGAADDFSFSPQNVTLDKVEATAGGKGLIFEIQPPAGSRQGFFYKATVDPSAYGE